MSFQRTAIATILVLACTASLAQSTDMPLYWGVEFGSSDLDFKSRIGTGLVEAFGGSATVTQNRMQTSKFLLGYKVNENLDLEGAYLISSSVKVETQGIASTGAKYATTEDLSFQGYQYAAILRPGKSTDWNRAFLMLGGHRLSGDINSNFSTSNISLSQSSTHKGTGSLLGLGYDLPIKQGGNLRLSMTQYSNWSGLNIYSTIVSVGVNKSF